jgi:alkylation response protein AidB-like acyl-CoA dehydrogenase
MSHIFLGIAEGALEEAKLLVLSRPDGERSHDCDVLHTFGELWLSLQPATALLNRASCLLQQAWDRGPVLTAEERGACALQISAAKVACSRAGLEITSHLFEVVGAGGVARSLGLDRHWCNLRTLSLHDPEATKIRAMGAWAVHGHLPEPGFYF